MEPTPARPPPVQEPEPEPEPPAEEPAGSGCDPNYTPCVPLIFYDLDCGDIGFSVVVIGSDLHGFDGNDYDGLGRESYGMLHWPFCAIRYPFGTHCYRT